VKIEPPKPRYRSSLFLQLKGVLWQEKYQRVLNAVNRIGTVAAVLQLLNHVAFWRYGHYRSLAERIVGMKLASAVDDRVPHLG
jgi:hypothetical protein